MFVCFAAGRGNSQDETVSSPTLVLTSLRIGVQCNWRAEMETTEDENNPLETTPEGKGMEPAAQLSRPTKSRTSRIVDVTEEGRSVIITGMATP